MTLQEALVHLAIVTTGVLIALSLNSLAEWSRDRALVREARTTILQEIRDNRAHIEQFIAGLYVNRAHVVEAIEALNGLPDRADAAALLFAPGGTPDQPPTNFLRNYTFVRLSTISRTTAEITGALALMDFAEVQRYAAVYDFQDWLIEAQSDTSNAVGEAFSLGQFLDFRAAVPEELDAIGRALRRAFAGTLATEETARLLLAEYDRVLAGVE